MNNFDRVIGYAKEKEELLRLCDVLKNSAKYTRLGVKIPKAILLYGEPGLGKTLMAKAFIAETGRKVFHCKKNKSNGEFVAEIKSTFENAMTRHPLSSLTTWTSLLKIICNKIATRKNLSQFKLDWKILWSKTFLLLPLPMIFFICRTHLCGKEDSENKLNLQLQPLPIP